MEFFNIELGTFMANDMSVYTTRELKRLDNLEEKRRAAAVAGNTNKAARIVGKKQAIYDRHK